MSTSPRVAIVNRGEAATRFLQTATDLRVDPDRCVHTIALFTEPDRHSLFVRRADEAFDLSTLPSEEPNRAPYLDHDLLLRALTECRADMVWVGWGFVSEDADFAEACEEAGITFVGPSSTSMRLLADKVRAKELAERAGVPVTPWSGGPVATVEAATRHAGRIGFPLMVKSAAGGGGMGIREVVRPEDLADAFEAAQREALRAFGDGTLFLEKRVDAGRHIEVQILADRSGTIWPVGVRECSIQRRRQKVLEESGFSRPSSELESRVREHAVAICRAAGYYNAGTVEFLIDEATGEAYFMEVNTRLQVEHTVTELTSGLDLVREQLRIARGESLSGDAPLALGHAIEVRLNAEDPDNGFAPSPGRVAMFRPPQGPGVRTDSGIEQGDFISSDFDSMVAKIIAWGPDRDAALRRLQRALEQTDIVVQNGATNKAFLLEIVRHPDVAQGSVHTRWLDDLVGQHKLIPQSLGHVAVIQAAIESFRQLRRRDRDVFLASALHGRPELAEDQTGEFKLRHGAATHSVEVAEPAVGTYRVVVDETAFTIASSDVTEGHGRLTTVGGRQFRTFVVPSDDGFDIEVDGVPHRVQASDGGVVRAAFPGVVVSVRVEPGQPVLEGDTLLTIESMKLESRVLAPAGGTVLDVHVAVNNQVGSGQPLVQLDIQDQDDAMTGPAAVLAFDSITRPEPEPRRPLEIARSLVLGLDSEPDQVSQLGTLLSITTKDVNAQRRAELDLLSTFCDLHTLAPRRVAQRESSDHSRGDHLLKYLSRRGREEKPVSDRFMVDLQIALAHYGNAADADLLLMHVYRSLRRAPAIEGVIVAILLRWLEDDEPPIPDITERARRLLDRLIDVTDAWCPKACGLARSVRSRYFVQPVIQDGLDATRHELRSQMNAAVAEQEPLARDDQLGQLAQGTTPWASWLPAWIADTTSPHWESVLTVMLHSIHRHAAPSTLDLATRRLTPVVAAEVDSPQGRRVVVAAYADDPSVAPVLADAVAHHSTTGPVSVELLTKSDAATVTTNLSSALAAAEQVTVHLLARNGRRRVTSTTYDVTETGLHESKVHRNLHPTVAERLELWRLREFQLTQVDAPVGIHLFAGTSHEDERDRRLFALTEVTDLRLIEDDLGEVTSVPALELALTACLDAFRHHDSTYSTRSPYGLNRAVVYVEPTWNLPLDVLHTVASRVAHASRGLSLDQVIIRLRTDRPGAGDVVVHMTLPASKGIQIGYKEPSDEPVSTLRGDRRVAAEMRRRGLVHPWDIVRLLTSPGAARSDLPPGTFTELDLVDGTLAAVDREPGSNVAGVVIGLVSNVTAKHPEGMTRVVILNDPSRNMGSLGEPECARIVAALDLAARDRVPVEWFAVSSGARVSMDSGTENLDWTARVLRRIIELTQTGLEINVVLTGINVGAQSYWDAEATMLMHTSGILVSVGDSAMVLTGKQALDYSGAVSADDNAGIGGYESIMGPNGQAQYWTADVAEACHLLFRHYEFAYITPGEHEVRRRPTDDPTIRTVAGGPHELEATPEFSTVGDVFDQVLNPERKKPFDIRSVMTAVHDADDRPLERWPHMRDAENAVVWDAHVGGIPVCLIGVESHDLVRHSIAANDGPGRWSAGTLFPKSSKKVARALNSASGIRPTVILANLSGFDGSPESMRQLQLEFGAEIGRAVVNYRGPVVFCVLSRYHGGAFVVFSKALNDGMQVLALEGARASVLGGAPAAAVVFARDVAHRAAQDSRVKEAERNLELADDAERGHLEARLAAVADTVRSEVRGAVGREFDAIHTIERARSVGSVDRIIPLTELRPAIVDALLRGLTRRADQEPD